MTATVAALFVDPRGPYWTDPRCDCWDEKRDARNYRGPLPVVAHPPCQLWINYASLNFKRYGGEHNRPGNDGGCFAFGLSEIRRVGGVLEHPADSKAFAAHGLPSPLILAKERLPGCTIPYGGWLKSGDVWVCEVWQSAYGHRARKRTWLAYSGKNSPAEMNWKLQPGTHQIGWFDRSKPTLSKREASRTPPAFADTLINLAANCGGAP